MSGQGRIQKFQKGWAGSQILERGAGMQLFSAAFSHFLINLLQIFHQKGGGGVPSGPSPKSGPGGVQFILESYT